jgi:hypothetical protein
MRVFLDWGVLHSEREGAGNAAVNILRVAALRAAADLAAVLGREEDESRLSSESNRVTESLLEHVWDEREGRFRASIDAVTPAVHANILALRYGIGETGRILAYLEPLIRENFRHGTRQREFSGFAELYFFYYLLPGLAIHGRGDLAEALIREHYGYLKSLGAPTLPENFHGANQGNGSSCHSWSGAPAIYATEYILGLRLATPGVPDAYLLAPASTEHESAEGTLPRPQGIIHVRWNRRGNRFAARVTAPKGVTILPASNVDMADGQSLEMPRADRRASAVLTAV